MDVALDEKVNRVKSALKKTNPKCYAWPKSNSIYRLSRSRISTLLFSCAFTAIKS